MRKSEHADATEIDGPGVGRPYAMLRRLHENVAVTFRFVHTSLFGARSAAAVGDGRLLDRRPDDGRIAV
jgi:hypothetical protein